jgi:hypothetical protein
VSLEEIHFTQSNFQNVSEFMDAIVGLLVAAKLGRRNETIILRGDSVSTLTWAEKELFRSDIVANASVGFAMVSVKAGLDSLGEHCDAEHARGDLLKSPFLLLQSCAIPSLSRRHFDGCGFQTLLLRYKCTPRIMSAFRPTWGNRTALYGHCGSGEVDPLILYGDAEDEFPGHASTPRLARCRGRGRPRFGTPVGFVRRLHHALRGWRQ